MSLFSKIKAVRVQKIIMSGSANVIGTIKYNNITDGKPTSTDRLDAAKPLFYNFSQYPTINEIVYVVAGPKQNFNETGAIRHYYFPPINLYGAPNHNAQPNQLTIEELNERKLTGTTGYFQEVENIRPLQPYEGDIMIEGRYGNSIRFGSTISGSHKPNEWSNKGERGNPITIIRNGQVGDEQAYSFEHVLEDINGDDSSIYLCSNQQISNFQKSGIGFKDHELSYKHML